MIAGTWKRIRPYLSNLVRFFHISFIEAKAQYHGAYLGLLWIPLSALIFSAMLALVFRHSETMAPNVFFLYVLIGYTLWSFIASSITESTELIQRRLDFAIHNNLSLAGLFGKLLIDRLFAYFLNLILVIVSVLLLNPGSLGTPLALFPVFLAMIVLTSLAAAYLVNLITIFFPDTKSLFSVGVRFMFFVSPVFWSAADGTSGPRAFLLQYNPAAYFLSLPRQVFGIEPLSAKVWLIAGLLCLLLCLMSYVAYARSQHIVRNMR